MPLVQDFMLAFILIVVIGGLAWFVYDANREED